MAKSTLFTGLTGAVDSVVLTVTTPMAIDIDFTVESDELTLHRLKADGITYKEFWMNGPVTLNGKNNDSKIIVRPGDYKFVGTLDGAATCIYEALP